MCASKKVGYLNCLTEIVAVTPQVVSHILGEALDKRLSLVCSSCIPSSQSGSLHGSAQPIVKDRIVGDVSNVIIRITVDQEYRDISGVVEGSQEGVTKSTSHLQLISLADLDALSLKVDVHDQINVVLNKFTRDVDSVGASSLSGSTCAIKAGYHPITQRVLVNALKSWTVLSRVVIALSDELDSRLTGTTMSSVPLPSTGPHIHVPFRENMLTRVLQHTSLSDRSNSWNTLFLTVSERGERLSSLSSYLTFASDFRKGVKTIVCSSIQSSPFTDRPLLHQSRISKPKSHPSSNSNGISTNVDMNVDQYMAHDNGPYHAPTLPSQSGSSSSSDFWKITRNLTHDQFAILGGMELNLLHRLQEERSKLLDSLNLVPVTSLKSVDINSLISKSTQSSFILFEEDKFDNSYDIESEILTTDNLKVLSMENTSKAVKMEEEDDGDDTVQTALGAIQTLDKSIPPSMLLYISMLYVALLLCPCDVMLPYSYVVLQLWRYKLIMLSYCYI